MRSSEPSPSSSSSIPFKSKKPLNRIPKAQALGLNPLTSKTPEKPPELPRRTRNRNVALSLKEVRKAAESLRESNQKNPRDLRTDQISSAKRKIVDFPDQSAAAKSKADAAAAAAPKLPEKYEILSEFFNSLDNSIRLLQLKGSALNFTNIRPKIEYFTDRRFTYTHLAQLKFILPEVIVIKKALIFDERTSCMKPDLHISMNLDALEKDGKSKSEGGNLYLRKIFRSRLADFSKSHPEVIEVPKETLPEPFRLLKEDVHSDSIRVPPSSPPCEAVSDAQSVDQASDEIQDEMPRDQASSQTPANQLPAVATHLSHTFRRRFSQNSRSNEVQNTPLKSLESPFQPSGSSFVHSGPNTASFSEEANSGQVFCPLNATPSKELSTLTSEEGPPIQSDDILLTPAKLASTPVRLMTATAGLCPPKRSFISPNTASSSDETSSGQAFCQLNATPSKVQSTLTSEEGTPIENDSVQSTPSKLASTPARLMTATPGLCPPKRSYMSPEDNSMSSPNKLVRRPPRTRSLKFDSPVKNNRVDEVFDINGISIKNNRVKDEVLDINGISIDNDVLDILPENLLQSIRGKEMKSMEERDPAISQAKRRRQMIACLPKLFNMIHFLFQSINRSVITKEELVHKIISSNADIVDKREVEEQLSLLLELVPDWISKKIASGGDLLFRINKLSSPESIRSRLEEAK
ncbi:DNA replication factor [Parasponia andersonii]|uniref:DNA replication factor n=1 Tax=Parasponia andersonii TaxID=3476 RepID=A0A2P5CNI6_PARAD|nr:DNA replication factor [Parasponia andersonii]